MQLHDAISHAIDHVLAWDLPDDGLSGALFAEAGHLAGLDSGETDEAD